MEEKGEKLEEFKRIIEGVDRMKRNMGEYKKEKNKIKMIGMEEEGEGGYLEDEGFNEGKGWEIVEFKERKGEGVYEMEVQGE